jgi:hypothetical protein
MPRQHHDHNELQLPYLSEAKAATAASTTLKMASGDPAGQNESPSMENDV